MEQRKYSTGTKGRIKMHGDMCREYIRANSPGFSLANEFIESLDPEREDRVWQRFQSPEDILPELQSWLGGAEKESLPVKAPAVKGLPSGIKTASQLTAPAGAPTMADAALQRTRAWLSDPLTINQLNALTPAAAAEAALQRFHRELTAG